MSIRRDQDAKRCRANSDLDMRSGSTALRARRAAGVVSRDVACAAPVAVRKPRNRADEVVAMPKVVSCPPCVVP